MVVFVDLDESPDNLDSAPVDLLHDVHQRLTLRQETPSRPINNAVGVHDGQSIPRTVIPQTNSPVTAAFACYPIVMTIASLIDLNTLDSLSRTCQSIHYSLLQSRKTLIGSTLHCSFEATPVSPENTFRYRARASNWYYMEDGRNYNGKSGDCARDMVSECRRCGVVVCRNCAIKPPAPATLNERHRRLCVVCARAALPLMLRIPVARDTPVSSEAVTRELCQCEATGVWLCQPCGRSIRGADSLYSRLWRWHSHYGEDLGGLGTGIGEGDRGITCGREEACLAARVREQEVDCDAEDARDSDTLPWDVAPTPASVAANGLPSGFSTTYSISDIERPPSAQFRPGYERHQIEGIGGRVKTKLVRIVRVGASVTERDDRKSRVILAREKEGLVRSWCGWCNRVIPAKEEIQKGKKKL